MNPIYKFELSDGNTTQRAFPIYKDDLAKDFEKESGQEFFRAKLSGNLTFESEDYTFIISKAFDTQFVLEIFISYNAGQTWTSYWRGTFWKTDCEFDGDEQTVKVKPTVYDQYNDVLAGLDKEYNLIDLAPEIAPVKADKRPMIQVYVPGQTVIGCFLSGMWWEQECEAVNESDTVEISGQTVNKLAWLCFTLNKSERLIDITHSGSPTIPDFFAGIKPELVTSGYEFTNGAYKFVYSWTTQSGYVLLTWEIVRISDDVVLWRYVYSGQNPPIDYPMEITMSPVSGSGATGNVVAYIHDINVYSRYICDTPQVAGVNTYPIPTDDIVENNRNYHRMIGYYFPDTIYFSTRLTSTPNQWGLYQPGQYYQPPYLYWDPELFPIARNGWGRVSIWFTFSAFDWIVEESGRQPFSIRYAYPLASVLSVLLAKVAPGITHAATTDYSQFLYGTNLIGISQTLLITPKSNIVSSGYDQPAQKAPITLKNVLDMLRDCFRCYWFVDNQNRFRVEHIEYFRRGGSYSSNPVVGIDLTAQKVTRNGKAWAFGRDQFKFDKPEMAARYQFGWMDDVTQLFDGFPIDIISKYVNPDNIEQIDVSKFTSDIDYILLNPGAVSKDGFVLLSALYQSEISITWMGGTTERQCFYGQNGVLQEFTTLQTTKYGAAKIDVSTFVNSSIRISIYASGNAYCHFVGENDNLIETWNATSAQTKTVPSGAKYLLLSNNFVQNPSASVLWLGYYLPYINFQINGENHYLQNALVAFYFLQNYYAYDMPAYQYSINGVQMYAMGIKKLKTQQLKFPALNDPDLVQLIKTNMGNGMIQKLSVNLSSRNANATLKYDTE